eukprot:g4628.t1
MGLKFKCDECKQCAMGRYQDRSGQSGCKDCPVGKFQDQLGQSACKLATASPTQYPTAAPTKYPTASPTKYPTTSPTNYPTALPTSYPTAAPTGHPTAAPTKYPTASPTPSRTTSCALKADGLYMFVPPGGGAAVEAWCIRGWVAIQQRTSDAVDFYRDWATYASGFGDDSGFWLGNDAISRITRGGSQLRVELGAADGGTSFATYDDFRVGDAASKYLLTVSGYNGTAGDAFSGHNGRAFSTKDQDNDQHSGISCSVRYKGAWWYGSCHSSNLNGHYYSPGPVESYADGIVWRPMTGYYNSLKTTSLLVRPLECVTVPNTGNYLFKDNLLDGKRLCCPPGWTNTPNDPGAVAAQDTAVAASTSALLSGFSVHSFEPARVPFRRAVAALAGNGTALASVVLTDVRQAEHALDGSAGGGASAKGRRLAVPAPVAAFDSSRGVEVQFEVHSRRAAEARHVQRQLAKLQHHAPTAESLVVSVSHHMQSAGLAPPPAMSVALVQPVRVGPTVCSAGFVFRSHGLRAAGACMHCPAGTHKPEAGATACKACGTLGAAVAGSDVIGKGQVDDGRTSCTPDIGATVGLTACFVALGLLLVFFARYGPLDCGKMSWAKRRMIIGSSGDFISDGFYIATAVYDSQGLKAAATVGFFAPTAAFMVFRRKLIYEHICRMRKKYQRYLESLGGWTASAGQNALIVGRAGAWLVLHLGWYPLSMVLAINCKLFGFESFAKEDYNEETGKGHIIAGQRAESKRKSQEPDWLKRGNGTIPQSVRQRYRRRIEFDTRANLNKAFNLSILFELLLSTLPSLAITVYNWYATGASWDDRMFLISMAFSCWALVEGAYPLVFWIRKLSFTEGIKVELFDDWECTACNFKNGAETLKCGGPPDLDKRSWFRPWSAPGKGTCSLEHPAIRVGNARRQNRETFLEDPHTRRQSSLQMLNRGIHLTPLANNAT